MHLKPEKLNLITIIFLFSPLLSCQTLSSVDHDYPSQWPSLSSAQDGCGSIVGDYRNLGASKYEMNKYRKYLSYYLVPRSFKSDLPPDMMKGILEHDQNATIRISLSEERRLDIYLLQDSVIKGVRSYDLQDSDYRCKGNILWIHSVPEMVIDGLGAGRTKYSIGLQKAVDGSLIGQLHITSLGMTMWVIPSGGKQILWFKWMPVN